MKSIQLTLLIGIIAACGGGESLQDKKQKIDELRSQVAQLNHQIEQLETDLIQADPDYQQTSGQYTLISTFKVLPQPFEHRFEVRASVASRRNVLISAETNGRIEAIHVRDGDQIKKGQLLITLDASILENSVQELKTQLNLATTIYEKRKRLWEQNVGSEVQYLESRTNMETLQRKLATTNSQLRQARVTAPFDGVVDNISAKLGEMAMFGSPMIRILSVKDMHLEADISEKYLGKLQRGDSVSLYFPAFDDEINSVITSLGHVINQQNRTFPIEIALPGNNGVPFTPNLIAIVKIRDYHNRNSLVVPSDLIQQDNQGNFVYAIDSTEEALIARKLHIATGKSYQAKTEVLDGVQAGTVLINAGHREVTDGALVQVAERELL
ncbi:MAG: MexH family multidrug efflux RND transporter periplasmic adaptor subunit [Cyclobacteriaceae bacterium]|nr:MAG: MexH family multidrug efflux RND transporter periplasmic adaptor subunit [Cyclobacteriaceae bacterium]